MVGICHDARIEGRFLHSQIVAKGLKRAEYVDALYSLPRTGLDGSVLGVRQGTD